MGMIDRTSIIRRKNETIKKTMNRDRDILTLWRERPLDQQKEMDVMSLYYYIQKNQPELFHGIGGDPYQYAMGLL
jgi:hypothetical protein